MGLHGEARRLRHAHKAVELRGDTELCGPIADGFDRESATRTGWLGLLFDYFPNQQLGPLVQLEHLEADNAYGYAKAPEKRAHPFEALVDSRADEQQRDFALLLLAVQLLPHPLRQPLGVAEPAEAGLELGAKSICVEAYEGRGIVERLAQRSGI